VAVAGWEAVSRIAAVQTQALLKGWSILIEGDERAVARRRVGCETY